MTNPTIKVQMSVDSAIVARNTDYNLQFSILQPTTSGSYTYNMIDEGMLDANNHLYSYDIDLSKWKTISKLEVV